MGMPQKKKLSLSEHHKPRPVAERRLNTGDGQNRFGGSGAPKTNPGPAPCTLSVSGTPAVEMGDSLEISWKTFLSVLRSMEEGSENKLNALVPQLVTSQPVLTRKKIVSKSEKLRKGRSSALPVIFKPGDKANVKERELSAVVHSTKQDGEKIRIGSGQPEPCGKTPKGDICHAASKGKPDQASTESDYTQLSLSLPDPKGTVQRPWEILPLVPQENVSLAHKLKKGLTNHKDRHQQPAQVETLSQPQLSSQESSRLGSHKVFRQRLNSSISVLPHLECQAKANLAPSAVKPQPQDATLPQIGIKNLKNVNAAHPQENRSQGPFFSSSLPDNNSRALTSKAEAEKGHSVKLPLTAAEALKNFKSQLTLYEQREIKDYKELWFLGLGAKKIEGHVDGDASSSYDDDHGSYKKILNDHIAYRYEVLSVIGKGSFGHVVKCLDHKTGEKVAVKIIRNKKRFHNQALVEVSILTALRQKDEDNTFNVVHMKDYFYFRNHFCISFELLGINLYELIKKNNFQGFTSNLIRRFTQCILKCLQLLYTEKIIHCDLKPHMALGEHFNQPIPIWATFLQSYRLWIKLLRTPKRFAEKPSRLYTYVQSRFYRSPEVILGHPYATPIDMWSLGCIMAELYTGYPLFPGENESEQLACIMEVLGLPPADFIQSASRRRTFFDSNGLPKSLTNSRGKIRNPSTKDLNTVLRVYDGSFLDFLKKCLVWKPGQRMTPEEAMHHTWLQETHAHKAKQRIKTAPKLSDKPFIPPEKKKENIHKNAPPERDEATRHHPAGEVKCDPPEKPPGANPKLSPITSSPEAGQDENQEPSKLDTPETDLENPVDKILKREPRDHRNEKVTHKNTSILPPIKYKQ
ncbi:hypothetical protein lerEdw1_011987 [Lerista edwardsae]|nr:hypothetical protein lerEdw1_011987 [Lerista edwardsae]